MKNIKGSITRLIKSIKAKLPEEEDILGFAGISQSGIISSLNESYNFLDELEKKKETFEVVLLKRKVSELLQEASDFLSHQLDSDKKESLFNNFLTKIANIKYHIKATYLLVIEDSIRSESRIIELKRDLSTLEEVLTDFEELKGKVLTAHSTVHEMISEISDFHSNIDEKQGAVSQATESVQAEALEIKSKLEDSKESVAEINSILDTSKVKERTYKGSLTKQNKLSVDLTEISNQIKEKGEELAEQLRTSASQQLEIQKITEDANRASMAGSFKTRKEELDKPIKNAEFVMNGVLVVIVLISSFLLWTSGVGSSDFDYIAYLSKMTVVAPLIWIAWSSSRKLGYLTRIREDYAFKFASAMAYEGYKREANEVDADLLKQLLTTSIENMGINPIRLFDAKNNHASPMHESVNTVSEVINNASKTTKDVIANAAKARNIQD